VFGISIRAPTLVKSRTTQSNTEDFLTTINPESLVIAQGFVEPGLAGA